jgi:hypothetical protein
MKEWTDGVLSDTGHTDFTVYPGPQLPENPDCTVVITPYGGAGTNTDDVMDARSWQFRVISEQEDYESGESVANAIDIAALSHFSSDVGGVWVSDITRVGGSPAALMVDEAGRTHFVCNYSVNVALSLSN